MLGAQYNASYADALAKNQDIYNKTMGGFGTQLAHAAGTGAHLEAGYGNLRAKIGGDIQGMFASQKRDVLDRSTAAEGAAIQANIQRGLGNSTVANQISRGFASDRDRSYLAIANQEADTRARYDSSLGLAELGNVGQQSQLYGNILGNRTNFDASVSAPYPDARFYQALAAQQAAAGGGGAYPWESMGGGAGGGPNLGTKGGLNWERPTPGYGQVGSAPLSIYSQPVGNWSGGSGNLGWDAPDKSGSIGGAMGWDHPSSGNTIGSMTGLPDMFGGGFSTDYYTGDYSGGAGKGAGGYGGEMAYSGGGGNNATYDWLDWDDDFY